MAKLSGKMLVAVALALSLITAGLVYQYLQSATTKTPEKTNTIVMAKTNIQPKTVITSDMVQESQIPAAYMQPGTVTDRKIAVGALARDYIAAGEHIVERNLIIEGKSGGFTTTIPTDKRAITIGCLRSADLTKPCSMILSMPQHNCSLVLPKVVAI